MGQDFTSCGATQIDNARGIARSLSRTCIRAVLVTDPAPVGFFARRLHAFGRPHKSIRPASIYRAPTFRGSLGNDLRGYYS